MIILIFENLPFSICSLQSLSGLKMTSSDTWRTGRSVSKHERGLPRQLQKKKLLSAETRLGLRLTGKFNYLPPPSLKYTFTNCTFPPHSKVLCGACPLHFHHPQSWGLFKWENQSRSAREILWLSMTERPCEWKSYCDRVLQEHSKASSDQPCVAWQCQGQLSREKKVPSP